MGCIMSNKVVLAQVSACFSKSYQPEKEVLLITGGRQPDVNWLQQLAHEKIIYCADHGLDICRKAGIMPHYVIGDGDSAESKNWQWAVKNNIPMEILPQDKDYTDTQVSLKKIIRDYHAPVIYTTGIWGGRFDHLYSSIFSLAAEKSVNNIICCGADDKESIFILENETVVLECKDIPQSISLVPLSEKCHKVSIDNVKWPLTDVTLMQNKPYAISNVLNENKTFTVTCGSGILGLYFYW